MLEARTPFDTSANRGGAVITRILANKPGPSDPASGRRVSGPVKAGCAVFFGIALAGVAACSGGPGKSLGSPTAGLNCLDDSAECIAKRQATLKYFLSAPDRAWIRQRPDAAAYASGVRLFAYKRQMNQLSCSELKTGLSEANGASKTLKAGRARLTPAQVSRGKLLAREVARQLQREHKKRCKA